MKFLFCILPYITNLKSTIFPWCLSKGFKLYFSGSGVIDVQIGYQRVRQVHAHPLSGLSLLQHVYLTSYARY